MVVPYATPESLEWVREHASELAAVMVEPVQSRHPDLQPFEFLRAVRALTAARHAFVLDEVVTGFRIHPGGMQALAGIRADMATYGKVVGGGLPIGILAGKARFMDALDGGAGSSAMLRSRRSRHVLRRHLRTPSPGARRRARGPATHEARRARAAGATRRAHAHSWRRINACSGGAGSARASKASAACSTSNPPGGPLATLLFYHLRLRGIHIQDGFPCFLTTEHSDADLGTSASLQRERRGACRRDPPRRARDGRAAATAEVR